MDCSEGCPTAAVMFGVPGVRVLAAQPEPDGLCLTVKTDQAVAGLLKDLKARGFKFVGPTIVYAWMQAVGIVNDHALDCFRREELLDA